MIRVGRLALSLLLAAPLPAFAADSFVSEISAFSDGTPVAGTHYIFVRTGDPGGTQSLEFKEYAALLRKALAEKGLIEAMQPGEAAIVIDFNFGIDSRSVQRSTPTYGQVGVKTEMETRNVFGQQQLFSKSKPVYGVTGSQTSTATVHRRWMTIKAFDADALRATKSLVEKWSVQSESEGSSGDLRRVVPVMVYASRPYIGTSSGRAIEVKVKWKKKDADIVAFLGPPPGD
jgi:hypothetical protein